MGNSNNSNWFDIGSIGLQGITNGFTSFISQLFAKDNMAYQAKLNKELAQYNQMLAQQGMQYQHNLNEVSAQNAYNRNMQMYQQTQSTQAKVRELEQAGLSVGMLQGTPSAGGASVAGQANTGLAVGSAGNAGLAVGTAPILDIANAKLALAQARNIENSTNNNSVGGIDYQIKEEQKRLFANQADVEGYNADVASIDAWIKAATTNNEFKAKQYEFEKVMQEYLNLVSIGKQLEFTNEVNEETKQQQIDTIKNNNEMILQKILEIKSGVKLNNAQVSLIASKIQEIENSIWVNDENGNKISIAQADYNKFYDQLENELWKAGINAGGQLVGDLLDAIISGKTKSFYPKKPNKGVRDK